MSEHNQPMNEKAPLLQVEQLVQHFHVSRSFTVRAVNGVSFRIYPGETYGLVGESGSGKTTIGRSIIRLYNPTGGRVVFEGKDITGKMDNAVREKLRKDMQMIFQDPMASLNPRKKVEDIIGEGLKIHRIGASRQERQSSLRSSRSLPAAAADCQAQCAERCFTLGQSSPVTGKMNAPSPHSLSLSPGTAATKESAAHTS